MNIPTLTYFDKRGWTTTPTKYAIRATVCGLAFGAVVTLVGLSFFGGFAFAALMVGSYTALVDELTAWRVEKTEGRNGVFNQALSVASASVPFVLAFGAWLIAR